MPALRASIVVGMSHIIHLHRRRLRQCQGAFQVHNDRHDIGKLRLIKEARLQRGIQTRSRIRARLRRHLARGSGRREFDLARLRNGRRRETDTSNGGDNTGAGDGARDESRREAIGFDFGPGVFGRDVANGSRQAERLAEIAETDQVGRALGDDLRNSIGAVGETAEEETVLRTGDWFDHTQLCGSQVIELMDISRSAGCRLSGEL